MQRMRQLAEQAQADVQAAQQQQAEAAAAAQRAQEKHEQVCHAAVLISICFE